MILKKKYDEFISLFCKKWEVKNLSSHNSNSANEFTTPLCKKGGKETNNVLQNDINTEIVTCDNYSDAIKYGIETLNKFVHLIEDLKQQKWYIESFTIIPDIISKFERLLNNEHPNLAQLIQYKYKCEEIFSTNNKNEINKSYNAANDKIVANNNEIDNNIEIINKLNEEIKNRTNDIEDRISELNREKNRKVQELSKEIQGKIRQLESELASGTLELEQNTRNIIKNLHMSLRDKNSTLHNNIRDLTSKNQLITKINMIFNNFMECSSGKEFKQYLKYISTLNVLFQKALSIIDYNNKLLNEDRERSKNNKKFNRDILNNSNNIDSSSKDNNIKSNDENKNKDYLYSNNTNTTIDSTNDLGEINNNTLKENMHSENILENNGRNKDYLYNNTNIIQDNTNNLVEISNNIQEENMYCRNTLNNNNKSYLYGENNNTDVMCDNIIEINCDTSNNNRVQYNKSDLKYNIEEYINNMRKKNDKLHEDNMNGILNDNRQESFYNNGTRNNDEVA